MKTIQYNKLVRDKIPEIIQASGNEADFCILEQDTFVKELTNKLSEEVNEYLDSKEAEELADILEVIYTLAAQQNISVEQLEMIRKKKADERGGFHKRIYLKKVHEKQVSL